MRGKRKFPANLRQSPTTRADRYPGIGLIVRRRPLRVVQDEGLCHSLFRLQLEPELLLDRLVDGWPYSGTILSGRRAPVPRGRLRLVLPGGGIRVRLREGDSEARIWCGTAEAVR